MNSPTYNILFVCTGNSARSILAEGLMNHLGQGKFNAFSAGSHPTGEVNPLALHTLAWLHLPTEGYRSKNWDEFAQPESPALDFVFTVCDKAAGEVCPVWPGQPRRPTGACQTLQRQWAPTLRSCRPSRRLQSR